MIQSLAHAAPVLIGLALLAAVFVLFVELAHHCPDDCRCEDDQ